MRCRLRGGIDSEALLAAVGGALEVERENVGKTFRAKHLLVEKPGLVNQLTPIAKRVG